MAGARCNMCKNRRYLLDGRCVRECPPVGFTPTGAGKFNLRCVRDASTHTTSTSAITPTTTLPDAGSCIARRTATGDSCLCNPLAACHECSLGLTADGGLTGTLCFMCKGGRYLHEGACLEACPVGYEAEGAGLFNLRCVMQAPDTTPATTTGTANPPTTTTTIDLATLIPIGDCVGGMASTQQICMCNPLAACHECSLGLTALGAPLGVECRMCKNGRFLLVGRCVDECPPGYLGKGSGRFNLRCAPSVPTTAAAIDCGSNGFVYQGGCVAVCPEGAEADDGMDGVRRCVDMPQDCGKL